MKWRNDRAREQMRVHGRTPQWVADQVGVKVTSLRNMLRGGAKPSLSVIRLMAVALECTEEELLPEDGRKSPS